jgi:hypothetical protein
VICVLRRNAAVVGTSSAYAANLPLLGGRRFWMYRNVIDSTQADQVPAMIRATFAALEAEFDGSPGAPIGLCVFAGEEERRRRPQAEWSEPRMLYAGYLHDGRQVRIAYFDGARIA